jgi:hypothetical protein
MASKTVKFEIELKGLRVKFEGDVQIAERFSGEIAHAVNNLASAQNRLLPSPHSNTPQAQMTDGGVRRGVRRRKRSAPAPGATGTKGIDPAVIDGATVVDENGTDSTQPRRRRTGAGPSALIVTLKDEGFFGEKRAIGDIRAALGRKGHTYQSNEVSPTLVSLTQQAILQREKNDEGQWVYFV